MDLFTYLLKKKGHNSSVNGDLFSYLLASRKRGTYQTYTGTQINVVDSINAKMKNWILGGNTNQNGTPTPDAPIDIHNVIGENNVIENSGKNLYEPIASTINLNGLTPKIEVDGSISVNGTPTQTWSNVCQTIETYLQAGTYTFSIDKAHTYSCGIRVYTSKEEGYEDISIAPGNTKITKTLTNKIYGWRFFLSGITIGTELDENIKFQVETGSQATPFEKYKGKNYKVSLFNNITIPENQDIYITGSGTNYNVGSGNNGVAIPIKANTSYQISVSETMSRYRVGTTTIFSTSGGTLNNGTIKDNSSDKITINNTTDNYLIINVSDLSKVVVNEIYELCKIGDYQDKIYKSNDKWYLEKNTKKMILTSTLGEWKTFNKSFVVNSNDIPRTEGALCSAFVNNGQYWSSTDESLRGKFTIENASYQFKCTPLENMPLEDFTNWLDTTQPTLYCGIPTPITTEITDDNLINQLEELAKARSFDEQTNITQLSEQLPFDLTVDIKTL